MSTDTLHMHKYVVMGPHLQPDNGVLEAIYSLFYLPMQYELVLPFATGADVRFRKKVDKILRDNDLESRVHVIEARSPAASPEAFASAVLRNGRLAYE